MRSFPALRSLRLSRDLRRHAQRAAPGRPGRPLGRRARTSSTRWRRRAWPRAWTACSWRCTRTRPARSRTGPTPTGSRGSRSSWPGCCACDAAARSAYPRRVSAPEPGRAGRPGSCLVAATNRALPQGARWTRPPAGVFVGFFYYIDDAYNYLSYAQQAEDGAFLFRNKMVPEDHAPGAHQPGMVGWWAGCRALLGGRPALAYRLFGIVVALALVAGGGSAPGPPRDRPAAPRGWPRCSLVFTGAGAGRAAAAAWAVPGQRCLDLTTGLFPFIETAGQPALRRGNAAAAARAGRALRDGRPCGRPRVGLACSAWSGPYDLGTLLVAARGLGAAAGRAAGEVAARAGAAARPRARSSRTTTGSSCATPRFAHLRERDAT